MQLAVLGELEGELLAWLEQAQGIRALELVDGVQIRGAEAEALEDDPHVVAAAYLHLLGDVARLGRGDGLGFGQQRLLVDLLLHGQLVAVVIDRVATACSLGQAASIITMMLRISTILRCQ